MRTSVADYARSRRAGTILVRVGICVDLMGCDRGGTVKRPLMRMPMDEPALPSSDVDIG